MQDSPLKPNLCKRREKREKIEDFFVFLLRGQPATKKLTSTLSELVMSKKSERPVDALAVKKGELMAHSQFQIKRC